ncbi:MAG: 2-succinyl-5-enolpyruvyl-6-hydroxy-3-cyclohexene-1-carboxylic-acid synthase [Cyanobacteria bacterium M_surface_10_m1_298]|nr:2-succinyl-5-enolpyruvyl-6-hydroxy-3-cyclohexene-1-carboxylic-acid synthase [Cyanobacteria bacterium M_surface_10_m1_298]
MPLPPAAFCSTEANLRAALTLLQALQALGLRRLVLCPGSRSAPLALAAGLLSEQGLELWTGIDERSAAFLALGLSRHDGVPAAVVTTSGTAVANLLPAAVEADYGAVPLLLLTADRPQRLKGCGANQTVNQEAFLSAAARALLAADPRGLATMDSQAITALAQSAWEHCQAAPMGPVHLNVPFEEPLHASASLIEALQRELLPLPRPVGAVERSQQQAPAARAAELLDPDQPGVVVVGPWRGRAAAFPAFAEAVLRWQQRSGWPVFADALSGLRGWPGLRLVRGYDLLLAEGHGLPAAPQLLRLGPVPASRRLQNWICSSGASQLLIQERDPRNFDALGCGSGQEGAGLEPWLARWPLATWDQPPSASNLSWSESWLEREEALQQRLSEVFGSASALSEPALAHRLSLQLPPGLPVLLANSSPVRDWESFSAAEAPHRPVYSFRGASGIDGTLSVAAGLAAASDQLVLISGDLALLHDANGWLWREQLRARGKRLTVVVIDNRGGGIFEQLPIRPALDFERLFAMPQCIDLGSWAQGYGIPWRDLQDLKQLDVLLHWAFEHPLALVVARTDRQSDAELRHRLRRTMVET